MRLTVRRPHRMSHPLSHFVPKTTAETPLQPSTLPDKYPTMDQQATTAAGSRTITGKIIRKKKRPEALVINVKPPEDNVKSIPVHVPLNHDYEFLFLYAVILVQCHEEEGTVHSDHIELIQCSPTPTIIPVVMQGVLDGRYPSSVLPDDWSIEDIQRILDLPTGRQKRTSIAEISRVLEGRDAFKPARKRLPFVKRSEWRILEELERVGQTGECGWTMQTIQPKEYDEEGKAKDDDNAGAWENLPLNIPEAPTPLPDRGPRPTREEYIVNKKLPQVRWMVRRVQELYQGKEAPRHILDVGGGRGDLATALALALPTARLTVVDVNPPSLEAGKEYAHSRGCGDRIDFVLADMADFVAQENPPSIDLVVALHACGDLSDLAVSFASKMNATFVICPCCYGKRHIPSFTPKWENLCDKESQAVLRRVSELNEKPEVSRLSMKVINSMRFRCMQEEQYCVTLEQYDISKSVRNHVFVGTR